MEDVFDLNFRVPEDEKITLTYEDDSKMSFDEYEWDAFREGIKENIYDKGLLTNIELSWMKNT